MSDHDGMYLASNMLDVPNFFWDSEPTLHPLYHAVREYLEIKPRIQVLNERCRVFLDLAEILSDSIADHKMSRTSSSFSLPLSPRSLSLSLSLSLLLHFRPSKLPYRPETRLGKKANVLNACVRL
jgi:hypothetical protein